LGWSPPERVTASSARIGQCCIGHCLTVQLNAHKIAFLNETRQLLPIGCATNGKRVYYMRFAAFRMPLAFLITAAAAWADAAEPARLMPPNPKAIRQALERRGQIPAGATEQQAQEIVTRYLRNRLAKSRDLKNPLAAAAVRSGEKSGRPSNSHGRIMAPNNSRFDNVLTLLVEFAGTDGTKTGPLHNQIAKPGPDETGRYWRADFSPAHYQDLLFNRKPNARSMATYYLEQSGGAYTVDGATFGWIALPHSESFYGANAPGGFGDDLNGPVWRVVADAVKSACQIPWKQFDKEDPFDVDGDGNTAEPDGYVDHVQVVHAGMGEEVGGGAQGEDAIWSHSSFVNYGALGGGPLGGSKTCDPDVLVGPYTINPEDGTIGVFTHEFAHDLGLPDLYDTIYSGEPSTGHWTLMSVGSYLGCPGQAQGTCPAPLGAWEKWVLGWLKPDVVQPGGAAHLTLRHASSSGPANKVVQIVLPDYSYTVPTAPPLSGNFWYSGTGDMLNNTLAKNLALPSGATLTFQTWFDIEKDWDYGFVEISIDGGANWQAVKGNLTTDTNPHGNNSEGHGLTGNSGGWKAASYDLSSWGNRNVWLRFRYETDQFASNTGWAIDNIQTTGSPVDSAEQNNAWVATGWEISNGSKTSTTFHYYMAEWRQPSGFNISMNDWFDYGGSTFDAAAGMLLWYRNGRYADNWVGVHPWAGQLLAVDSRKDLVLADDLASFASVLFPGNPVPPAPPFSTLAQTADATFSTQPVPAQPLMSWFGLPTRSSLPAAPAEPTFDDSKSYVDPRWLPWFYTNAYSDFIRLSISSVRTPTYGLKITVTDSNPNAGKIKVDFTGFRR
jgi:immune inhibitor A